ncbi:MAG: acyl-CoA thioesterase [Deltaproteobacteria bacterium]|nr:acyl-CoA thioesterase [Deltaproteobacteria bacterium]
MNAKRACESTVTSSILMVPQDANPAGNVHGGVIMKYIDETAGVVAFRHSRSNAVTASIDRIIFHHPVFIGNLLTFKACVNMTGRTSMEIGVRVESENLLSGEILHTASAYLTFVALDSSGRPTEIPQLIVETEEEIRRHRQSQDRRAVRLEERDRELGASRRE